MTFRFLDLFAGAGGLSEGFIQAGYTPVAHVEMDKAACYTLRTRAVFHELNKTAEGQQIYKNYLLGKITREQLYKSVPTSVTASVIEEAIGEDTLSKIFDRIDSLNDGQPIDVIIGGPPCQAYSLVGRSKKGEEIKTDHKNYLFKYYVEFLQKYKPRYFVFENVPGLYTAKDKENNYFLEQIRDALSSAGYKLFTHDCNAEDYGVPQRRKRIIIIGCKKHKRACAPELQGEGRFPSTISKLFSDLKHIQAGEGSIKADSRSQSTMKWLLKKGISDNIYPVTYHQARPHNPHDLEIYRNAVDVWVQEKRRFNYLKDVPDNAKTHKNTRSFLDRFKVVDGNSHASHTVVAHICKDGHYYIHPDKEQNRSLTPREAARLQTFPDNYFFETPTGRESRMYAFRQIGNAVPVLLAKSIADQLKPYLES